MVSREKQEDTGEFWLHSEETIPQVVRRNREDIDNHIVAIHGDRRNLKEFPGLMTRVDRIERNEGMIDARLKKIEELLARIFWTIAMGAMSVVFYTLWNAAK